MNELNIEYLKLELIDKLEKVNCPYKYKTLWDIQRWIWEKYNFFVSVFLDEPIGTPYEYIYCIQSPKFDLDIYGTMVSDKTYTDIIEAWNDGLIEALKYINNGNGNEQQD